MVPALDHTPLRALAGPLLWHFENNSTNDPSIELDLEEVKALVRQMGFRMSVRFLPFDPCHRV